MTDFRQGEVPEGMVPWAGGDSAPDDWDGGAVMIRDGSIYLHNNHPAGRWLHGQQRVKYYPHRDDLDIIAYTPSTSVRSAGERERMREIAAALKKRMDRACDRTRPYKGRDGGVIVTSVDWHGLMDLAEMARAALKEGHQP
jgi:hypothetical protein